MIRHVLRNWRREKKSFLILTTVYGWIIFMASFAWLFAGHGTVGVGFWAFLAFICVIGAFAAALLIWHAFVNPTLRNLAKVDPSDTRVP